MGASNASLTFIGNDRVNIAKQWAEQVQMDLYENGHSYSGSIGMLGEWIEKWHDLKLPTQRAAADYIDDKHEKWEPGIAVSFKEEGGREGWVIGGWCAS